MKLRRMQAKAGRRVRAGGLVLLALLVVTLLLVPSVAQAAYGVYTTQEIEFLGLINQYRQANGLGTLLLSDDISDAAEKHSKDMGKYGFFDHTSLASDYFAVNATPWQRMAASGYVYDTYKGENIAAGQATAAEVFNAWKNSSGHNANMLKPEFKVIGISLDYTAGSPYGDYWTTDFGGYVDASAHDAGGGGGGGGGGGDSEKPILSFATPINGATVSGDTPITLTANDNVGVTKVELRIDGSLVATDTGYPYTFTWHTASSANGGKSLGARAYDAAGNYSDDSISVTVLNAAPTTTTVSSTTTTSASTTTTSASSTTTTAGPTTTTTPPATTTASPTTINSTTTTLPTTTTSSTTTTLPPTATTLRPVFQDVPSDHRFYREVTALAGAQIIGGFSDGSFRPEDEVTRAQFAKVVILAIGEHTDQIEFDGQATFSDVPWTGESYPFDYVEEAFGLGVIKGLKNGNFGPYDPITRAQLALMLVRAGGDRLAAPPAAYDHGFTDVPAFADDAVRIARYNELLSGKTADTFDPYGLATRGQVAKMTSNLIDRLGG